VDVAQAWRMSALQSSLSSPRRIVIPPKN